MSDWFTLTRFGAVDLVRLSGELDIATTGALGRELGGALRAATAVVVDLTAVSFLDSSAIRLLDGLVGDLSERGASVRLVVPARGAARMALRLWAFPDDLIDIDLDTATAAVGG